MPDALSDALRRVQSGLGVSSEIEAETPEDKTVETLQPAADPVPVTSGSDSSDADRHSPRSTQPNTAADLVHDYSRGFPQSGQSQSVAPASSDDTNTLNGHDEGASDSVMAPLARVDRLLDSLRANTNGRERKPPVAATRTGNDAAQASSEPGAKHRESVRLAADGVAESNGSSLNLRKLMRELPPQWSAKIVACAHALAEDDDAVDIDADERTVANSPPRTRRASHKVLFMWDDSGAVFVFDDSDDSINGIEIESRYDDWEVTPGDFQRYVRGARRFPDKGIKSWSLFRRS